MAAVETCARGHLGCTLSPQQLFYLAEKTAPKDWKRLLLDQGISGHVLDQVEFDYQNQGCVEIAWQGFRRWQQKFPGKVSLCQVTKALSAIGRNDLKNDFESKYLIKGIDITLNFFSRLLIGLLGLRLLIGFLTFDMKLKKTHEIFDGLS